MTKPPHRPNLASRCTGNDRELALRQVGRFNRAVPLTETVAALVRLAHELGREDRRLTILGEGNVSAKLDADRLAIKASGTCLATLQPEEVTVCHRAPLLALLDQRNPSDAAVEEALLQARVDGQGRKPSMESVFHAWLLTLEGVHFVAHCHPLSTNQVLCSPRARDFAERRLFPDEVVYCGPASVFVPYTDPGLPLAREVAERTRAFQHQTGQVPRLILLQNHGAIALGPTPEAVLATMLMAEKAAAVFAGAAAMGGPNFLRPEQVDRLASRPDEAYRQRQLRLAS